jgi:hypothetical protein
VRFALQCKAQTLNACRQKADKNTYLQEVEVSMSVRWKMWVVRLLIYLCTYSYATSWRKIAEVSHHAVAISQRCIWRAGGCNDQVLKRRVCFLGGITREEELLVVEGSMYFWPSLTVMPSYASDPQTMSR